MKDLLFRSNGTEIFLLFSSLREASLKVSTVLGPKVRGTTERILLKPVTVAINPRIHSVETVQSVTDFIGVYLSGTVAGGAG
jgi:hypothetical protein